MDDLRKNQIGALLFQNKVKSLIEKSDPFQKLKVLFEKKDLSVPVEEQRIVIRTVIQKNFAIIVEGLGINFGEIAKKNAIPEDELAEYIVELLGDILIFQ